MSYNMSRSSANPSDRGSSPRTPSRRSGHSGLSHKNAELILRQLKDIQADVERIGEGFRSSLRGLQEDVEDLSKTMGAELSPLKRTKRGLDDLSNNFASIKADTAELRKDFAELRVESQETRRRVALVQGDMECARTCVSEFVSMVTAPATAQAATQTDSKAGEKGGDSV